MPPRAAKKSAAKKPSTRSKRSPLTPSPAASVEELPTVEEEEMIVEAQASPAIVAQEDSVEAEEKMSPEAEGCFPEVDASPCPTENDGEEDVKDEEVAAAGVSLSAAVEEGLPLEAVDMGEAADLQEDVEDHEASVKSEVEQLSATPESTEGEKQAEVISEVEGAEIGILEKGTVASEVEGTEACEFEVGDTLGDGVTNGSDNDSDNGEDVDEVDPTVYMSAPLTERKRNKEFEIFIGGLGKEAVEDDLLKVFGEFGEIQSARIVKHPVTQKSKGFAFIRFATVEQAKKALADLKDGTEIRGKRVGISASVDNDTLYLGNICRTWTKDQVLETLKGFGVEPVEEILLPDDPKKEGNNKGFAFLEFSSHSDAMAAFQRLRKPDAIFGCDRSAKVAFAQFSMHPSEEAMSQVKSVYVEGLPRTWDEEKVKEICKQYGEIEKVLLSRNFRKSKRKDFGFVAFTSRESAMACVEGINGAEIGEEDIKVKASLAKPQKKGRLAKQGVRGGFKVENDGVPEDDGQHKSESKAEDKETHEKEKALPKLKGTKDKKSKKSKSKVSSGKSNAQYHQKNEPPKGGKRGRKGVVIDNGARPSKKARSDFNFRSRPSGGFGSQRSAHFGGRMRANDVMRTNSYASGHAESATGHQLHSYVGASESMHRRSDLEPHAGYLPAARQGRNTFGYPHRSADAYENQQRIGASVYKIQERISAGGYDNEQRIYSGGYSNQERPIVSGYYNPQGTSASYPEGGPELQSSYPGYSGYEGGYPYTSTGAYAPQGRYY